MTENPERAKRTIGERVELFARQREQYRLPEYKKARLCQEFLDPFFDALGQTGIRQIGNLPYAK